MQNLILIFGVIASSCYASPLPQTATAAAVPAEKPRRNFGFGGFNGIGAAAGIGGLGTQAGLGGFKMDTGSQAFSPWGAFAGIGGGPDGGGLGAGCSGLTCGVQLGQFTLNTRDLFNAVVNRRYGYPKNINPVNDEKKPEIGEIEPRIPRYAPPYPYHSYYGNGYNDLGYFNKYGQFPNGRAHPYNFPQQPLNQHHNEARSFQQQDYVKHSEFPNRPIGPQGSFTSGFGGQGPKEFEKLPEGYGPSKGPYPTGYGGQNGPELKLGGQGHKEFEGPPEEYGPSKGPYPTGFGGQNGPELKLGGQGPKEFERPPEGYGPSKGPYPTGYGGQNGPELKLGGQGPKEFERPPEEYGHSKGPYPTGYGGQNGPELKLGRQPFFQSTSVFVDRNGKVTTVEKASGVPDKITTGKIGGPGGLDGIFAESGTKVEPDGTVSSFRNVGSLKK